jgi:hypothetical protein
MGWSELEKDFFQRLGSPSKFTSIMRWLKENEYIVKDGPPGFQGAVQDQRGKSIVQRERFHQLEVLMIPPAIR